MDVDTTQNLGDEFQLNLEKVFLCSGKDGYIPKYNPGQGEFGCLADSPNLQHSIKILVCHLYYLFHTLIDYLLQWVEMFCSYCKRVYFRWGKISRKCWQDISRVGNSHDSTPISLIKAYGFYFRMGVIFTKKTKTRKTQKLPLRDNFHVYSIFMPPGMKFEGI